MSNKQPDALRLADVLDIPQIPSKVNQHAASAELRRLHALNAQMLEALRHLHHNAKASGANMGLALDVSAAAIAAATGGES